MKNSFTKTISLIAIPVLFCNCTRYYMVHTETPSTTQLKTAAIDSLNREQKYFVMHADSSVYAVRNLMIDTSALTIAGMLTNVPPEHSLYLRPHRHFIWGTQRTFTKSEAGILNEVHLYTKDPVKDSLFNIPTQNIQKIETIEYDKQKTTTITAVGIVILVAAVVVSIVAISGLSQWGE